MSDLDTVLGLENAMVYHSATLPVPTDSTVWRREERMGKWDTLNYAKIKFARGTHKNQTFAPEWKVKKGHLKVVASKQASVEV